MTKEEILNKVWKHFVLEKNPPLLMIRLMRLAANYNITLRWADGRPVA
jgi:hypothetical protein